MSTHHDADAQKLKHCLGRLLAAGEVDGTTDPSAAVQTLIRAHPEYGRRPVGPLRTAVRGSSGAFSHAKRSNATPAVPAKSVRCEHAHSTSAPSAGGTLEPFAPSRGTQPCVDQRAAVSSQN